MPLGDWDALDDVTGDVLPLKLVQEARKEGVEVMEKRNIWELRHVEECYKKM